MVLFDTHCHLDFPVFDRDRDEVIQRCDALGIQYILIPGVTVDNWEAVIETASLRENYYPALGLHPYYLHQHVFSDVERLVSAVQKYHPVAIGEIGLDYHVESLDKSKQIALFEAQLDVAVSFDLPVVLHVRKAHDDVLKILRQKKVRGGTVHAYSGSYQQALQYIDLGFKLGFGGSATFDRSKKLHRFLRDLPLNVIVLETDAPDMPPQSHQGERNSPYFLAEIAEAFSQLRDISIEILSEETTKTAREIFSV